MTIFLLFFHIYIYIQTASLGRNPNFFLPRNSDLKKIVPSQSKRRGRQSGNKIAYHSFYLKLLSFTNIPVAVSPKRSISRKDEFDWGAAGALHSFKPQNRIHHIHERSFSNVLQYSMKRPCLCLCVFQLQMGFKHQEHWTNSQNR